MSTFARTYTGDIAQPRVLVTDRASVAVQKLRDLLSLWQGEWFLDQTQGFPWFQRVFAIKNPDIKSITQLLRQTILSVPGITDTAAAVNFVPAQRTFQYAFAATLNTGQTITGGSGQAFVIDGSASQ